MPRKFFRRISPDVERVRQVRALRFFGDTLFHPRLWALNRRSAAGGFAAGLFCGLIPGPFQMLGAALVAIACKVNLPIALATTLYTNPLTIVPLYLVAFALGQWILGPAGAAAMPPPPDWEWSAPQASMQAMFRWIIGLGAPLALGVSLLASLLAVAGYGAVRVTWSIYLRRAWHARRRASRARS